VFGKQPFYTSKVGRRAILLFVLSALVPVTLLAALSGYEVWVQLEDVAGRHLHKLTKSAGLRVITQLEYLDNELRSIAAQLAALPASERQSQLQVIGARQQTIGVLEFHPPRWTPANRLRKDFHGRPAAARTSLWAGSDPQYPIVLGRPVAFDAAAAGVVLMRLPLGMLDLALDEGVEHCILDQQRRNIGCSDGFSSASEQELRNLQVGNSATQSWLLDSQVRLMSAWSIFLGGHFNSDNWLLVLDQPLDSSLYGSERFVRLLVPVIAFTLVLVMLISSVAIRRNLVPLARLRDATRRIAGQDLASRVQIDSKDEFKELGDCFNDMADSLSKQFTLIGTMGEIDRLILSAHDVQYVVQLLCQRIPELMPCDFVAVGLVHRHGDTPWIHYLSKSKWQTG
jgi:HAMP domain-containing protein